MEQLNVHYWVPCSIRVRIRFSVWLVSGYAHVFELLYVVIVTLPLDTFSAMLDINSQYPRHKCGWENRKQ